MSRPETSEKYAAANRQEFTFAPRQEINSEQRAVLNYYVRTHRGLVPDAIEALLWSHDAILGIAQALIEAEPGDGGFWEAAEQELRAYVDAELEARCNPEPLPTKPDPDLGVGPSV